MKLLQLLLCSPLLLEQDLAESQSARNNRPTDLFGKLLGDRVARASLVGLQVEVITLTLVRQT